MPYHKGVRRLKPYHLERQEKALDDPVIGPALKYTKSIYPEDVGLSVDFCCAIW